MPVFGEVVDIIVTHAPLQECILVLHPLLADYFDKRFHAYHTILFKDCVIITDILNFIITKCSIPMKFISPLITACM